MINCVYGDVPTRGGNYTTVTDSIISAIPTVDSAANLYVHPTTEQLTTWGEIVAHIINEEFDSAYIKADELDYDFFRFKDNLAEADSFYYFLAKKSGTINNYWGTFIFNSQPERQRLVLQAPHSLFDFNTGKQGFYIFKDVKARALFINGTHRCNATDSTSCAGTTSVCGEAGARYKISDQAHVVNSTFQKTTQVMDSLINNLIVLQLHGFTKLQTDPHIILSNGTKLAPSGTDFVSLLKDKLIEQYSDTLTFKIPHIDTEWDRLNGTTNTQGRFINGSSNPCNNSASSANGRFLHMEQSRPGLRNSEADWAKVSNAIANTFASDPLPVELVSFTALFNNETIILNWKTATEINNYGFEVVRKVGSSQVTVGSEEWEVVGFVEGNGNSNSINYYEFIDPNISGGIYYYRLKQIDTDGIFEYSNIISVNTEKQNFLPNDLILNQNYPNPFNPVTLIKYSIPSDGLISLKIYDSLGREASVLENVYKTKGNYEIEWNASEFSSGTYYIRLNILSEERKESRIIKTVLIK